MKRAAAHASHPPVPREYSDRQEAGHSPCPSPKLEAGVSASHPRLPRVGGLHLAVDLLEVGEQTRVLLVAPGEVAQTR